MKYLLTCFLFAVSFTLVQAQAYENLVDKAQSFYQQKKYLLSARIYQKAFLEKMDNGDDVLMAAKAWSMADNQEEAFKLLKLSIDKHWVKKEQLENEKDFEGLRNREEWKVLMTQMDLKATEKVVKKDSTESNGR